MTIHYKDYIKYVYHYQSPLGDMIMASDSENLLMCLFGKQIIGKEEIFKNKRNFLLPVFQDTIHWLDDYFQGKKPNFFPKIKLLGTDFQLKVWNVLQQIPYAHLVTYKDVVQQIANQNTNKKVSCQAVGGAIGHNPISVIIPCHRVVGTNHSLVGYSGGLDLKINLLNIEKIDISNYK